MPAAADLIASDVFEQATKDVLAEEHIAPQSDMTLRPWS
jgi:hypothetical protein